MSATKLRFVTSSNEVIKGTEETIIFNSAAAIDFNLGPAVGDFRSFKMKNIGAGAVTLLPYGSETIFEGSEVTSKVLATGETTELTDTQNEQWTASYVDFETVPLSEGGTGITGSGVTKVIYVDGGRSDSYTEDGSILRPYKTILAAQTAINAATSLLLGSEADYDTARYFVNIAPGIYSDNLTINGSGQCKYLRYNMEGVTISGNISITQDQVGVTDYYSKVEFFGGLGTRPEKGRCGRITGNITFLKTAYDSLAYDTFFGVSIEGDIKYGASAGTGYGTWVLCLVNSSVRTTSKSITTNFAAGSHCVLIEAFNSEVRATLTGVIDLYTCSGSSFSNMTITPANGGTIRNCTFSNTTSIIATKTLSMDACSYKSLMATTPTLTGITISHIDNIGANPTPVARTTGSITAAGTVNDNIDALDSAIGFEGQMSGTPHVVTFPTTVFQALDKLDTYKSVQTIKKTIGGIGVSADFNFVTAANTNEQVIDLGDIVPAKARIVDVFTFTDAVFTGATTLVAETGTSSSGNELIGSATIYDANAITATANAGAFIAVPSASATHVYVSATPGANWSNVTAGKVSVYVTYINVTNI